MCGGGLVGGERGRADARAQGVVEAGGRGGADGALGDVAEGVGGVGGGDDAERLECGSMVNGEVSSSVKVGLGKRLQAGEEGKQSRRDKKLGSLPS